MQFAAGKEEFHVALTEVEHRSTRMGTPVFGAMWTRTKRLSFENCGLPHPGPLPTERVKLTADIDHPNRNVPASADLANSLSPRERARATFVFLVGSTTSVAVLLTSMVAFGLCKGCYDAGIFASLYDVVPSVVAWVEMKAV